jgi:hypothetical protein
MDRLKRTAGHEAGHVIAAVACGLKIDGATIDPEKAGPGKAGCVWNHLGNPDEVRPLKEFSDAPLFELVPPCADDFTADEITAAAKLRITLYAQTIQALAGVEGARLLFPDRTPSASATDMQQAVAHAKLIASDLKAALALLDFARVDAARILTVRRRQLEAVSTALFEHKTLDGAEIADILAGRSLQRKRWDAMAESAALFMTMTGGGLKPLVV